MEPLVTSVCSVECLNNACCLPGCDNDSPSPFQTKTKRLRPPNLINTRKTSNPLSFTIYSGSNSYPPRRLTWVFLKLPAIAQLFSFQKMVHYSLPVQYQFSRAGSSRVALNFKGFRTRRYFAKPALASAVRITHHPHVQPRASAIFEYGIRRFSSEVVTNFTSSALSLSERRPGRPERLPGATMWLMAACWICRYVSPVIFAIVA